MSTDKSSKQSGTVVKYDFAAHKQTKEVLRELLVPQPNKELMYLHDPKDGELIAVARIIFHPKNKCSSIYIFVINPACVKNMDPWSAFFMSDVVKHTFSNIKVSEIYTHLHPLLTETIAKCEELGFVKLSKNKSMKNGSLVYTSMCIKRKLKFI